MRCDNCGCATEKSFLTGQGCVCANCAEAEGKRQAELFDELAKEPLDCAPMEMDLAAFQRWTLKLAVQTIRGLSPARRREMVKCNPVMLFLGDLASHINGLILDCMPKDQFKSRETGPRKGQFWFDKSVKFATVKRAALDAGVITDLGKISKQILIFAPHAVEDP